MFSRLLLLFYVVADVVHVTVVAAAVAAVAIVAVVYSGSDQ